MFSKNLRLLIKALVQVFSRYIFKKYNLDFWWIFSWAKLLW